MSAHGLPEEPLQGHVRSEPTGGTYNEMIKARPAEIPALLRSLHEQKSPQREVLAIELMTVIQNDVIQNNAIPSQWNALLEAGLHHLYVEILMTNEIYHTTIEPHSYLIGIVWGLHGMLVQAAVDDVDITRWNPRIADELIAKTGELWDFIWARRSFLQGEPEDTRTFQTAFGYLNFCWIMMMYRRDRVPGLTETRLGHVAIYLWQYMPHMNFEDTTINGLMVLTIASSQEDRDRLVQEAVVDTFGPRPFIKRFHHDLKNDAFVGNDLSNVFYVLAHFASHPAAQHLFLELNTYKLMFPALERQEQRVGEDVAWITMRAAIPLSWAFMYCDTKDLVALIDEYDLMKLMAHAMVLGAKQCFFPDDLDCWIYLASLYGSAVQDMGRAGSGSRLYTILMSALHRVWYPTLIDLRATSLAYAIKAWEEFGARVGIIEAEESAFWGNASPTTRGMSGQAASASTASSPLFCSWRECGFHSKKPPHVLQTCSGCKKASYCNEKCQKNDWKRGVHKKACKVTEN